jgi:hypothetical protein
MRRTRESAIAVVAILGSGAVGVLLECGVHDGICGHLVPEFWILDDGCWMWGEGYWVDKECEGRGWCNETYQSPR